MNLTIWLCGWVVGTFALYVAAIRDWRNPGRRRQWLLARTYAHHPAGILAFTISAFMFWWLYVLACPVDMWLDSRWRPEGDGDD